MFAARARPGGLADKIAWFVRGGLGDADSTAMDGTPASDRQLILCRDSFALAVAFRYRDHLKGASNAALDQPDPGTKVAPRLWCDFVDVLRAPLPDAMHELRELVAEAELASARLQVSFPAVGRL